MTVRTGLTVVLAKKADTCAFSSSPLSSRRKQSEVRDVDGVSRRVLWVVICVLGAWDEFPGADASKGSAAERPRGDHQDSRCATEGVESRKRGCVPRGLLAFAGADVFWEQRHCARMARRSGALQEKLSGSSR